MSTVLLTAGLRAANHASRRMLELRRALRVELAITNTNAACTAVLSCAADEVFRPNGLAGSVPPDGTALLQGDE